MHSYTHAYVKPSITYIKNNACTRVTNGFSAHERVILGLFSELRSNEGNKHQNNIRVGAETARHESTYATLFLTRYNESINVKKTTIFSHRPRVSLVFILLMTSQSIVDDVTLNWQLWRDHVKMIANSSDIDFIHCDLHGRSCKKWTYVFIHAAYTHSYTVYIATLGKRAEENIMCP